MMGGDYAQAKVKVKIIRNGMMSRPLLTVLIGKRMKRDVIL